MSRSTRPNSAQLDRRQFFALSSALVASSSAFGAVTTTNSTASAPTTAWNQWRGPTRDGSAAGDFAWPEKLEGRLTEVWRKKLQPSYSGPIVSDGRVFVTETADKKSEVVTAYSLAGGEELWKSSWSGAMSVPFFARSNGSWIRSTPAVAGDKLLVGGIRDVLVCLNAATGDEVWRNDFVQSQKSKLPSFGFVCSPLVVGDHAFVQAGGGLLKLEMATGKVVWRSLDDGGGMYGSAFSSPVVATIGGVEQLVVQTRKELAAVDMNDGKKLWSKEIPAFRGMNILPPTVYKDTVFTSSYGGGSFCYRVNSETGSWSVEQIWKNTVQGYMSSPMVFDDHVYFHLKNQRFTCMDLTTGSQKWSSRPYGKYWSSVTKGKRILSLDERGDLLLVEANPKEFKLIDKKNVASNAWAHLAVVDDLVLVRDLNALIVFRWA